MSAPPAPTKAGARPQAFRERAQLEAGRYGPDPWIFVRELLQNSRDAGARAVVFTVSDTGGREVVVCRDDGEGMSFEHARRYLFSLYASSKETSANQAGKFGVGFWSVLRFEPETITIRSRTRSGERWGLTLDGSLERAQEAEPPQGVGTEIVLERGGGDGRLEHRVFDAVRQSGRYLHLRDDPDEPLPVTINGRRANEAFSLPAPSASFRRGTIRGVVGLGPAPRVELFSRGLRVRSAASLEDLLAPAGRHTSRMRVRFPELLGGLAPAALLESDKLEVMLSRSDARENRALSRLVRMAQHELERLIDRQLAHARPQPWYRRASQAVMLRLRQSLALRTAVGAALGLLIAMGLGWALWGQPEAPTTEGRTPTELEANGLARGVATRRPEEAFRDLGARYGGPKVDVLSPGSAEPIDLAYAPAGLRLHFAALSFADLAEDGSPVHEVVASALGPYEAVKCGTPCVEVELAVAGEAGALRIPVPTGHRVVRGSVQIEGEAMEVRASGEGHPTVVLPRAMRGRLRYRTTPAADPTPRSAFALSSPEALPSDLRRLANGLRKEPVQRRVDRLQAEVQRRVRYDRTPATAARHADAVEAGEGFLARTLAIGAGDCDVQNGLLVALLHAAKVPARLAVGYVGRQGSVHPWLHAWVEFRDEKGYWQVTDASESTPAAAPPRWVRTSSTRGTAESGRAPLQVAAPESALPGGSAEADDGSARTRVAAASAPPARGFVAWLDTLDERIPWFVRGLPLLLLGLALWPWLGRRTRRAMELDEHADLSRLLQGVLQQPAAFSSVSALFTRPLVPVLGEGAISINRARELACRGRLYRAETDLPRRPGWGFRGEVVDARYPEGKTVADALGAVDLDRWRGWLATARPTPLTTALDRVVRERGEDWEIRVGKDIAGGFAVVEMAPLGRGEADVRQSRVVLVDAREPWVREAHGALARSPAGAMFSFLDRVVERLDLPTERRARLLSALAREAVLERGAR